MGTGNGKQIMGPMDAQTALALASRQLLDSLGMDGVLIVAFHEGKIIGSVPLSMGVWSTLAGVSVDTLVGHAMRNLTQMMLGGSRPQAMPPAQPTAESPPATNDRGIKLAED